MKVFGVFLLLVLIAVGYFYLSFHIVTTDSGRLYVRKQGMRFGETFVDLSGWEPEDLDSHPRLVSALVAAGHQELVDEIAARGEPEPAVGAPTTGGLGGIMDPVIESQSSAGSQKTGRRVKERARAAGGN